MELIGTRLSEDLKQVICDELYENPDVYSYPKASDIQQVQFQHGCAALRVLFKDVDGRIEDIIIDADPVLTVLLQHLIGTPR